jgi:hypothetical protein
MLLVALASTHPTDPHARARVIRPRPTPCCRRTRARRACPPPLTSPHLTSPQDWFGTDLKIRRIGNYWTTLEFVLDVSRSGTRVVHVQQMLALVGGAFSVFLRHMPRMPVCTCSNMLMPHAPPRTLRTPAPINRSSRRRRAARRRPQRQQQQQQQQQQPAAATAPRRSGCPPGPPLPPLASWAAAPWWRRRQQQR